MLTSLTLIVLLASGGSLSVESPQSATLLSLVPENSFVMARCDDVAALRSRAERNDWVRYLNSNQGDELLDESAREFEMQTGTDFSEFLDVAKELHGESLLFSTRTVAGFVTLAPPEPSALLAPMRAWLPDAGPESVMTQLEIAGAEIEVTAWPDPAGNGARQGHFAALVKHPRILGLFSGDDLPSLTRVLEESLAGLDSDRRSSLAQGFESARRSARTRGAIEFYIDFSIFVAEAERELARSIDGYLPDPSGMLGIDEGLWLYSIADVQPGTRFEAQGFLNVPVDTLAARLADTFGALPTDLPTRLPSGITNLFALDWDLFQFYQVAREAFVDRHGEESLEMVDQSLQAAESMSGLDPIEQVLSQLTGMFVLYFRPGEDSDGAYDFRDLGVLFSLADGEAFLDVFEEFVGGGPMEEFFEFDEIEGVDTYMWDEGDERGGMAFLPRHFVAGGGVETFTTGLRALLGVSETTLLDGSEVQLAFDQRPGACYFGCQRLADFPVTDALEASTGDSTDEVARLHQRLYDSLLVSSLHREEQGFRFEIRAR